MIVAPRLIISALIISSITMCCSPSKTAQTVPENSQPPAKQEPENTLPGKDEKFLTNLFAANPGLFKNIEENKSAWNVQVIYTQINRNARGIPSFTTHRYNTNAQKYFYPASTIKMPVALLALQKMNELSARGINKTTPMIHLAAYSGQSDVFNDPTTPDGNPTLEHYIKKIFLVSDNDAYNRLFEFCGQEYINKELHKKGYTSAQILHRLEIFLSEDENRHTNEIRFLDTNSNTVYTQPMLFNRSAHELRNDKLGKGYYSRGKLIEESMDFSKKNKISIEDLHEILKAVIFPGSVDASRRFNITEEDRLMVLRYMSQFPGESEYPAYDSSYTDAYVKFILFGGKGSVNKNMRIFNKVGDAYGHLIDVAYVVDFDKKIEFMVSAVIYCNSDEILNDDKYDYESIGFPFMKNLGRALYDYESSRKKKFEPDLSGFMFQYK